MDPQRRCLQTGAAAVALAILLRLIAGGAVGSLLQVLTSPVAVSAFFFFETGRVVEFRPTELAEPVHTDPIPTETATPVPMDAVAVFGPEDVSLVDVNSACGYDTDIPSWLEASLSWNLKASEPTVLIVHSHGTESYTKTEDYQESSAYRTKDTSYNVVSVGDRLVQALEMQGICAIHDRTMHDSPSYNDAYNNARESIESYLSQYPSIRLVLDIHRDAVADGSRQMAFTTESGDTAQLMLVVGTDAGGLHNPLWQENLALALKLQHQLEAICPGICRYISLRPERFNQDLSPGMMLIEVGAAGNTLEEALGAAEILAQAIGSLAKGTTADSTS